MLRSLILPPASPLIVGVAGLALYRRRPRLGLTLCAVCIVTLWALSTPILAHALARSAERYPALDPLHLTADQAGAGAIVVLGAGFRPNAPEAGGDEPTVVADLRLIEGARVARATHLPILVSGNGREAFAMKRFSELELGAPVRWVESASSNTHENALFSAALLNKEGIHHVILVTSSTHMARAATEFASAGLEVTAAPAEMVTPNLLRVVSLVPSAMALEQSYLVIYEWIGRLVQLGS
jgi:uncharacterized SAM-binding protein YcdF (DUF218 family)